MFVFQVKRDSDYDFLKSATLILYEKLARDAPSIEALPNQVIMIARKS